MRIVKKIKTSTKLRTKQLVRDAVYPLSTLPPTLTSPLSPNRNRFKRIKFSLLNLNTSAHTHTLYCFIQNLAFWNIEIFINSIIKIFWLNILTRIKLFLKQKKMFYPISNLNIFQLFVGRKLLNIKDNKIPEQILDILLVILAKLQWDSVWTFSILAA